LHGAENVFDFSLGNPNVEPPDIFFKTLKKCADTKGASVHGYMPNAGYPSVRQRVAQFVSADQGVSLSQDELIMTCGAAGGLNVILKAILDPGDEVIVFAPYFVEYGYYAQNHGGLLKTVPAGEDFNPDLAGLAAKITPKTKAVLINSPNNPTGKVYSEETLAALGKTLLEKSGEFSRTIYLLSDEPYRKIAFDGIRVPSVFSCYRETIITTSYSKELSIPGERIGWVAVNPAATHKDALIGAMTFANRILGFVNAPALMQRVVAEVQGSQVDAGIYEKKRDVLCRGLSGCGYSFVKPQGAFYLFPKAPIADDVAFVQELQQENILAVPGVGFGGPGHFRIAFCVDDKTIENAMPGFEKVMRKFKSVG
jgi:aspartate aminotransferase